MAQPIGYYVDNLHTGEIIEAFGDDFSKLATTNLCHLMEVVAQEFRIASDRGFQSMRMFNPMFVSVDRFPTEDAPKLLLAIAATLADRMNGDIEK